VPQPGTIEHVRAHGLPLGTATGNGTTPADPAAAREYSRHMMELNPVQKHYLKQQRFKSDWCYLSKPGSCCTDDAPTSHQRQGQGSLTASRPTPLPTTRTQLLLQERATIKRQAASIQV
jgi:hypothetical protein